MSETIKQKRKNVFSNKNYTLVFLGALVSNIASLFYSFAVSFYILKLTDNNAFIQGLYLAVGGITFCLVTLFGGVISDRFNKAKIMYICDYIKGISIIALTLLMIFVVKSNLGQLIILFIIAIISNAIAGIFSPASSAILPIIVEEESYQQAQSYFSILNSFQSIVGVVLAGILYTLIPIDVLFLIVGVCYIGSAISEMFIKYNSDTEKQNEKLNIKLIFSDIKEGFIYLFNLKSILILMLSILFVNFFFSPIFENFFPYFVSTEVSNSNYMFNELFAPEMWSSFFSVALGIGSLIMGIILSSRAQKEKISGTARFTLLCIGITSLLSSIIYILFENNIISINALLIIILVYGFILGLLIVLINVTTTTAMMKIVDKDKLGKVSSVTNIGSQGLIPLSLFLGGIALSTLGSIGLLIVCSSGLLLIAILVLFSKSINKI